MTWQQYKIGINIKMNATFKRIIPRYFSYFVVMRQRILCYNETISRTKIVHCNKTENLEKVLPITQEIISISIQEKHDVFIRNSCFPPSVLVSFGSSLVPLNLSAAFITSSPRKIVKEAACATNFMNGPRMILPNYNQKRQGEKNHTDLFQTK